MWVGDRDIRGGGGRKEVVMKRRECVFVCCKDINKVIVSGVLPKSV